MEIKEPYPFVPGKPVSKVRLHFFDESRQTYLFAIEEHNAVGYKIEREVTSIDIRNRISTTRTIVEDFKFSDGLFGKINVQLTGDNSSIKPRRHQRDQLMFSTSDLFDLGSMIVQILNDYIHFFTLPMNFFEKENNCMQQVTCSIICYIL
ncbi:hypothetical protein ACFW1P_29105 [Paenibacillus sp. NPDC058910]|uniref:hypothetical protein n=1 Tax=unclassified Paenibacillus TaxID=185978 RepID=UPI0036CE4636